MTTGSIFHPVIQSTSPVGVHGENSSWKSVGSLNSGGSFAAGVCVCCIYQIGSLLYVVSLLISDCFCFHFVILPIQSTFWTAEGLFCQTNNKQFNNIPTVSNRQMNIKQFDNISTGSRFSMLKKIVWLKERQASQLSLCKQLTHLVQKLLWRCVHRTSTMSQRTQGGFGKQS